MRAAPGVKTSPDFPIPDTMKAWVLGDPGQLALDGKAGAGAEAGRGAGAHRRGRHLRHRPRDHLPRPAGADPGRLPFNKNFTPGHEYMGTVVALGPGVDEFEIGERVTVEIHAGCGQCKRCREGMYTSCLNYGLNYGDVDKGHRANGFTTDGGFCEYQVNNINTLVTIADEHVGRGGDAGRHRRHRHVRPDRARRPGRRRERGGDRARARSACSAWRSPRRWAPIR